jgi:hypothetical protein
MTLVGNAAIPKRFRIAAMGRSCKSACACA